MTRTVPAALLTALSNPEVEPFYAVKMDFEIVASGTDIYGNSFTYGPLRLWTGHGDKSILSEVYTGSGNLLTISGLEEVSDLSARGTTLSLSGLPTDIVSYAIKANYQGRDIKIYWGLNGVSDVVEVFSGYMDKMTIQDDGDSATIQLTAESRLVALERARVRRYTAESHKAVRASKGLSGDDTFFDWVTQLQDKQIVWGREANNGSEEA